MSALKIKPEGQRDHSLLGVSYCLPEVLILITGRPNGEGHTRGVTSLTSSLANGTRCQVRRPQSPECTSGLRTSCSSSSSSISITWRSALTQKTQPQRRRGGRAEHGEPAEDEDAKKGEGALQENRAIQRRLHLPLTSLFALHHAGEVRAVHLRKLLFSWMG